MASWFLIVSKVGWAVARPDTWLLLLIAAALAALVLGARRVAVGCLGLAAAFYLAIGIWPLGAPLYRALEAPFPVAPDIPAPAAILVLGGAEEAARTQASGLVSVRDGAERFLQAVALARRHPQAKVAFTGGAGWFVAGETSGADVARRLFLEAGIAADRMILEGRARTTWQNAVFTRPLFDGIEGPVVLVTSAWHMRRAAGTFCAAGWRGLHAWPVDHRGGAAFGGWGWEVSDHLSGLDNAAKEWVGLAAYRAAGRFAAYDVGADGRIVCG